MRSALLTLVALGAALLACSQPAGQAGSSPPSAGECAACHMQEFQGVTHPPHPGVKPTTCVVCHTQEHWHPSVIRHEWPLTGAHAKVDCFGCHRGDPPVFHGTGHACVDCHRADAQKATFAAHATFGTTCEHCHTTEGWKPATDAPHTEPEPEKPATSETEQPATKQPATKQPPAAPAPARPKQPAPRPKPTPSGPDVLTQPSKR